MDLPRLLSIPVGLPWRGMFQTVARFAPDVVHLASPFVVGAQGLAVARRLAVPSVAVYQTDIPRFAAAYGMGLTSAAAWRWTCRLRDDPAKRWAFGAAARHAVRRRTWPAVCEELLGHYAVVTTAAA